MGGIASVPGRGRKAKPKETKLVAGNPGRRPLNKNAPDFTEVIDIAPPLYFDGLEYATQIWQSIVPELLKNKLLRINQVLALVPVGRSSWWEGCRTGRYPKPIKLGPRTTVW